MKTSCVFFPLLRSSIWYLSEGGTPPSPLSRRSNTPRRQRASLSFHCCTSLFFPPSSTFHFTRPLDQLGVRANANQKRSSLGDKKAPIIPQPSTYAPRSPSKSRRQFTGDHRFLVCYNDPMLLMWYVSSRGPGILPRPNSPFYPCKRRSLIIPN